LQSGIEPFAHIHRRFLLKSLVAAAMLYYLQNEERGEVIFLIKRKHALVIALAFSLTITLFIAASTGYDPWVDQDEDGDVDATDLNVLAVEYGSLGDPTKNVSVTNWPQPQKPTFAEILVLRGLAYRLRKIDHGFPVIEDEVPRILVDKNMPYPPVDIIINRTDLCQDFTVTTEWERQTDDNFTYVSASAPFFIQGDVPVRTTLQYNVTRSGGVSDVIHYNTTVNLEKITPDGTAIVLASDTISISRSYDTISYGEVMRNLGVVLHLPSPTLVEPGEILQIRFETWTRCEDGYTDTVLIELFHELGTDDFIAYIPIYQP